MDISLTPFNLGLLIRCALTEGSGDAFAPIGVLSRESEGYRARVADLRRARNYAEREQGLRAIEQDASRTFALPPAAGDGVGIRLRPTTEPARFWREHEYLPLEAMGGTNGSGGRSAAVARLFGTEAREPIQAMNRAVRVLVIVASPSDHWLPLADKEIQRMRDLLKGLPKVDVELESISGMGTMAQLAELRKSGRKRWDVVHVVAHGRRADGENPASVCLQTPGGGEDYRRYDQFSDEFELAVEDAGLITLAVCDSSPLAVELVARFRRAHVVGMLGEVRQETLTSFFGGFYGEVFNWLHTSESEANAVDVFEAYSRAVSLLRATGNPEWFLPVLYTMRERKPFIDLSRLRPIRRIQRLAAGGDLRAAELDARGLVHKPDAAVAKLAKQLLDEIKRLAACEERLHMLDSEVSQAVGADPTAWSEMATLHRRWRTAALEAEPTAGPTVVTDESVTREALRFLEETYLSYDSQRRLATDALGWLATVSGFAAGWKDSLLTGCRKLRAFFELRTKPTQVCDELLFRGVVDSLAAVEEPLATIGTQHRAERRLDTLDAALARVLETREAIDGELGSGLSKRAQDDLRLHCDRVERRIRELVEPLLDDHSVPAALLVDEHRVGLLHWLASPDVVAVGHADRPHLPLAELAGVLARLHTRPAGAGGFDRASVRSRLVTALANTRFPLSLQSALNQAFHPYLLFSRFGAGPDTSVDDWAGVETRVAATRGEGLSDAWMPAINSLTQVESRLCIDALLLPCEDPSFANRQLTSVFGDLVRGVPVQSREFADAKPLDRFGLLAASGQTATAAREALQHATQGASRPSRERFERVRAAYLLAVHEVRCALLDDGPTAGEQSEGRMRDAIGLLVLLENDTQFLSSWIRQRLSHYAVAVPSKLDTLLRATASALRRPLEELLNQLDLSTTDRERVRLLRQELDAESRGAKIVGLLPEKGGEPVVNGGYHAARLFGQLDTIGARLESAYGRLRTITHADYLDWIAGGRVSLDKFHEGAVVFSGLRLSYGDKTAIRQCKQRLPVAIEMQGGEPADVTAWLADRVRFPFHARLPPSEGASVLSAHLAWMIAERSLRDLREELGRPEPAAANVRQALAEVGRMESYLAAMEYRLAGEPVVFKSDVVELLQAWSHRLETEVVERDERESKEANLPLRKRVEAGCKLADELCGGNLYPGIGATAFLTRSQRLHLVAGVFVANVYRDGRAAVDHTERALALETANAFHNYVMAVIMYARQATNDGSPADRKRATSLLQSAKSRCEDFQRRHPEAKEDEFEQSLRDLSVEIAGPPPVPPTLGKVEKM